MSGSSSPRVSVVVPTCSRAGLLRDTIASVRAQSFDDWECIVADDGSTDDTAAVLAEMAAEEPRLRFLLLPRGGLPARARNAGAAEARGELLAFLDDDDLWHEHKLARQVAVLDSEPGVSLCFTRMRRFGGSPGAEPRLWPEREPPPSVGLEELLRGNVVPCSAVLCRRAAFERAGGFDPSPVYRAVEDYELWLRMARAGPLRFLNEVLLHYRDHESGIGQSRPRQLAGLTAIYDAARRDGGLSRELRRLARARFFEVRTEAAPSRLERLVCRVRARLV